MNFVHNFQIILSVIFMITLKFVNLLTFDTVFTHNSDQRSSIVSEIIAGHPSPNRDFFVHLQISAADNKTFVCGGTVIDEFFVVTAAHCIANASK